MSLPLPLGEGWGEGLSRRARQDLGARDEFAHGANSSRADLLVLDVSKPSSPTLLPAGEGSKPLNGGIAKYVNPLKGPAKLKAPLRGEKPTSRRPDF